MADAPRLWSTEDVAEFVGVSPRTVERWRAGDAGPRYIVAGRSIRYIPGSVRQWVEANIARSQEPGRAER